MKVRYQKHGVEEPTWELEEAIRKQYPNLFTDQEKRNADLDRGKSKVIELSVYFVISVHENLT
ncbi:Chromo domain-containing protein [Gossypium australe]|uniref:Chromo domain-containing protein n=1 Tax=Gossypium australe TaxID=47621 RepID=A0A5B6W9D2_9ROSI|nr:Chromo domain-containing protein [Gossypium australe]